LKKYINSYTSCITFIILPVIEDDYVFSGKIYMIKFIADFYKLKDSTN
ncbi:MAG: hypothetical protein K0R49_1672, partial [Burkholderiales bacterium]|nr:hypothetical protein [Burkholderiales bacterium]